jgi:hypothetical protein
MKFISLVLMLASTCWLLTSCRTAQDTLNMPINLVNKLTPSPIPSLPKIRLPGVGSKPVRTIR